MQSLTLSPEEGKLKLDHFNGHRPKSNPEEDPRVRSEERQLDQRRGPAPSQRNGVLLQVRQARTGEVSEE